MKLIRKQRRPYGKYLIIAAMLLMAFMIYKNPLDYFYNADEAPLKKTPTKTSSFSRDQKIKIAEQLTAQGKQKEAISTYKKILFPDKQIVKIHMNLAALYLNEKQYDDVIRHMHNALEANPQLIGPHMYIGKAYDRKKMYTHAVKHYQKVLDVRPDNFDAHLHIALSFMHMQDYDQALAHNKIAIKINPSNVHGYLNSGHVYNKRGDMNQAIAMYHRAIEIAPDLANAHYNLGYTLRMKGDLEQSLIPLDKAIELNPQYAEAHIARCQAYWGLKNFERAFEDYEWRWTTLGGDHEKIRGAMWDGSDLTGKKILVYAEQGLGDTFHFIRYLKLLKERGATVVFKPQKPLCTLLSSHPFIDKLITDADQEPFDLNAALLSLPRILKTQPDNVPAEIPYLQASPELVQLWQKRMAHDKNFKVGLCWHVDPKHDGTKCPAGSRSVTLDLFEPLAQLEGISFYSLQKKDGLEQLKHKPKNLHIKTFGPDFDESHGRFMDTAAVMQNLDLILTVDTSVAHLAGALGKPVWILMPYASDCRWYLGCDTTPWYPTARLFRQEDPGNFGPVLQNVAQALQKKLNPAPELTV